MPFNFAKISCERWPANCNILVRNRKRPNHAGAACVQQAGQKVARLAHNTVQCGGSFHVMKGLGWCSASHVCILTERCKNIDGRYHTNLLWAQCDGWYSSQKNLSIFSQLFIVGLPTKGYLKALSCLKLFAHLYCRSIRMERWHLRIMPSVLSTFATFSVRSSSFSSGRSGKARRKVTLNCWRKEISLERKYWGVVKQI